MLHADSAIAPGAFGEFVIIAGQLPDTDSLTFKAIQTYSDGSTVSWTDVAAPGSKADLDHPAPVLDLPKATCVHRQRVERHRIADPVDRRPGRGRGRARLRVRHPREGPCEQLMRPVIWWIAAIVVTVAGVAGLARGAAPQSVAAGGGTTGSPPIVVTGAYVRQPASPDVAAAYFTVYNTTAVADTLVSAASGAGEESVLHAETDGSMTENPNGFVIPAHGTVVFKPTTGHLMIEKLVGTLTPGQFVDISLTFANAGQVVVSAPVIGIYANPPTGAAATAAATPTSGGTS